MLRCVCVSVRVTVSASVRVTVSVSSVSVQVMAGARDTVGIRVGARVRVVDLDRGLGARGI